MLRQIAGDISLALVLSCAVIGLAGRFGYWSQWADVLNQFTLAWDPVGISAGLIAALLLSGVGRQISAASAVFLIILGCLIGVPFAFLSNSPANASRATLKLVQFNVDKDNVDPDGTASWLLQQNPDVMTIEEGLANGSRIVQRLSSSYPWHASCQPVKACSTIILSKWPIMNSVGLAHGDAENRKTLSAAAVVINLRGQAVTVVAVHLPRPRPYGDQHETLTALRSAMIHMPLAKAIVGGDFNMTPWAFGIREQDQAIGLRRLTAGVPTWPARLPGYLAKSVAILPIDHIYASAGLSLISLTRGPRLGSDHYPLVAVFSDATSTDRRLALR
jgi:endonuclease/exonuclease/phosphatase (EEP) superfamily protein YafD